MPARGSARARAFSSRAAGWAGTLGYIAPEIWADERYDTGADVWSFGMVVFDCVTSGDGALAAIAEARELSDDDEMLGDAAPVMRRDPACRAALLEHARLAHMPRVRQVLELALRIDPAERPDADTLEAMCAPEAPIVEAVKRALQGGGPNPAV